MTTLTQRTTMRLRRLGSALVIATVLGSPAGMARASEGGGIFDFFQQLGGGAPQPQQQPLPQPDYAVPSSPPLTVRMRPRKRPTFHVSRSPKDMLEASRGVTIYTDKTLARGDVVMTKHGLRIFAGSTSMPYTDGDFLALTDSSVPKLMRKELMAIDVASRVDAAR